MVEHGTVTVIVFFVNYLLVLDTHPALWLALNSSPQTIQANGLKHVYTTLRYCIVKNEDQS